MSGTAAAWTGIGAAAGVLGVVAVLLDRTLTPTREIHRYAEEIGRSIDAIAANAGGGAEIIHTRELALALPGLAGRLLGAER